MKKLTLLLTVALAVLVMLLLPSIGQELPPIPTEALHFYLTATHWQTPIPDPIGASTVDAMFNREYPENDPTLQYLWHEVNARSIVRGGGPADKATEGAATLPPIPTEALHIYLTATHRPTEGPGWDTTRDALANREYPTDPTLQYLWHEANARSIVRGGGPADKATEGAATLPPIPTEALHIYLTATHRPTEGPRVYLTKSGLYNREYPTDPTLQYLWHEVNARNIVWGYGPFEKATEGADAVATEGADAVATEGADAVAAEPGDPPGPVHMVGENLFDADAVATALHTVGEDLFDVDAAATALHQMIASPAATPAFRSVCDLYPRGQAVIACDLYKAAYRLKYGNPCRHNDEGEAVCLH